MMVFDTKLGNYDMDACAKCYDSVLNSCRFHWRLYSTMRKGQGISKKHNLFSGERRISTPNFLAIKKLLRYLSDVTGDPEH